MHLLLKHIYYQSVNQRFLGARRAFPKPNHAWLFGSQSSALGPQMAQLFGLRGASQSRLTTDVLARPRRTSCVRPERYAT